MDMSVILTQMGVLVAMMAVGYICAKLKVTGAEFTHSVAGVCINVLMCFTIVSSVMGTELSVSFSEMGRLTALFFLLIAISCLFGFLLARAMRMRGQDLGIVLVAVGFMNTVFVGYPVIESVFGAQGVFFASLSNIPFNIVLYSLGTATLSGEGKHAVNFRKMITPPMVATLISIVIMFSGVAVPEAVKTVCTTLGRATVPMSMLVIGTSLGMAPLMEVIRDKRVYLVALARLILGPLAVWAIARLFVTDATVLGVLVILAACPCGMIVTPLSIQYGADELFASKCVFMSTMLSAVTMPLMILLLL